MFTLVKKSQNLVISKELYTNIKLFGSLTNFNNARLFATLKNPPKLINFQDQSSKPHSITLNQDKVRSASTYSDDRTTHFGYKDVGEAEKKDAVLGVFHSVADSYDLMNDAMSLGKVFNDYLKSGEKLCHYKIDTIFKYLLLIATK